MSWSLRRVIWLTLIATLLATSPVRAELKYLGTPQPGLQLNLAALSLSETSGWLKADGWLAEASEPTEENEPADTEQKEQKWSYPWRAMPPAEPDYKGAARDTAYFLVYQVLVIGVLYVMPESISSWTDEDKENYSYDKWKENVSNPHWDEDAAFVNYVLHPYWGATYYVRGRERGFSRPQSLAFSFGLSFLYEYGLEALFEQPSYQDLIITPVVGSLIGEYWFWGVRQNIKTKPGPLTWQDKTVLVLTDPLGTASTLTDRMLGIDTTISLQIDDINPKTLVAANDAGKGASPLYEQRSRKPPAWGLRLNVAW